MLSLEQLETRDTPSVTLGAGWDGINHTGWQPPDTQIAVGPTQVLEVVNEDYAIYSKAGALLKQDRLTNLFAGFDRGSINFFDCSILYDEGAQRFVVAGVSVDFTGQVGHVDLAVSDSSDALGDWTERQQMTMPADVWSDNGKLGFNGDAYVYSGNLFGFDNHYRNPIVLSIDKASVLDANPATFTEYTTQLADTDFSAVPARMHNAPAGSPMWFVETFPASTHTTQVATYVNVIRMDNVLSATPSDTYTAFTVPSYRGIVGFQPGKYSYVETNDSRTLGVEWNNDRMVSTYNSWIGKIVGQNQFQGVTAVGWFQFDTASGMPVLAQQGTIAATSGTGSTGSTYYAAATIDAAGDIVFGYLQSSTKQYPSLYIAVHLATDKLGMVETPILVHAGTGVIGGGRAGDYAGIAVDPVDGSIWMANEYGLAGQLWGTWIEQVYLR